MLNFENLDKAAYPGTGDFDIPEIPPFEISEGLAETEFIPYNYARTCGTPENKGVHFFVDDYQFARLWNKPDIYLEKLRQFKFVLAPDFSTYSDMPRAMQIYNHYRKHWIARYLTEHNIAVIPTISWSTPDSFEWCFDGEPRGSVVAISNVSCLRNPTARRLFDLGFEKMKEVLQPSAILCYGAELDGTINIKPHYTRIKEARENGRKRSQQRGETREVRQE